MTATGTDARWFDSTPEEYHADPADSFSKLKDFDHSPPLYHGRYLQGTLPRETSDALEFGTALHCAVLEPERFALAYAVPPKFDRRTKAGKEGYAAWEAENRHKVPLEAADMELIRRLADSLAANPRARELIESSLWRERGIKWTCRESGLALRCRPDAIGAGFVVNLKTAQSARPDEFNRAVKKHVYHAQAVMDCEGVAAIRDWPEHFLVVLEKQAPWGCAVYQLTEMWLAEGRAWLARVRTELAARRSFDHWRSNQWNTVTKLAPDQWMCRELRLEEAIT